MTKVETKYLLDTSALLALWNEEKGAEIVEKLLQQAAGRKIKALVSFMTYMESYYRLWRSQGQEIAQDYYLRLKTLPLVRIDMDENILLKAAELKATKSLSVADSWIIATAIFQQAVVVHKDPEFEQVKDLVKLLPLPYKI
jgi:predicted nucleic acid-binding protein